MSAQFAFDTAVLANDEKPQLFGDFKQELERAEVSVRYPQIALLDDSKHVVQQRAFRGMAVFREKRMRGQSHVRLQNRQHSAGQRSIPDGAQILQTMLRGGQVVAIQD